MNRNILKEIANRYDTPLYVYAAAKIEQQYHLLKSCLPDNFEIFYSAKANPLLGICQYLKKLGSHIEVASLGELHIALEAGFEPYNMIYTSPGKTYKELEYAIENNIYSINIESVKEAQIIEEIALKKSKKVNISLRINPNFNITGASLKMSGVATQFGIEQDQIGEAMKAIHLLPNVNIIGIHIYTGSQMLDAQSIVNNMEEVIKLSIEISNTYQFNLEFLDLGGGFGIPYFNGEAYLNMEHLKMELGLVWQKYRDRLAQTRIGVESGRFLLAESGVFMTKILYEKKSKGTKYYVCDGGSNQHASSAFLGRYVRNNFPMYLLGKELEEQEEVNVVGSLCTPTDVMGQKVKLPEASPNDYIVIEKSGAYGLTHSPVLFLSHTLPAEVIYFDNEVYILRERGKVEDFLKGQNNLSIPEKSFT
jgi:diaminopimelate decarboxylase